jgi:DNA (cytosine-5)-methyltransferase 1
MNSLELFSGAGGLALGLEQAGFHANALVERDADACATLRANRPDWRVIESDVRKIDYATFDPVHLVAGGPPCQPFSMGGKANGYDDHRDMFPQAVRAVRELKPLAFIFENVRGLLRPAFRSYVEFVRLQLTYPEFPVSTNVSWETNLRRLERHHTSRRSSEEQTYNVTINLADAADYGVPQHRHRVFFVGFRHGLNARWFFPSPTHSGEELVRAKWFDGSYWREHRIRPVGNPTRLPRAVETSSLFSLRQRWRTVRDAISDLGEPLPAGKSARASHILQPGARAYPGHTGSPLDEPSKALKAGDHGVPGGENMIRYPNNRVRYLSVRESARIQTFPDSWALTGSWTESMRQLGNAVPVELARVVASSVAQVIRPHVPANRLQSTR